MTQEEADKAIESIYPQSRYRWCEAKICACMGCVNRNHRQTMNVTKEQWQNWFDRQRAIKAVGVEV